MAGGQRNLTRAVRLAALTRRPCAGIALLIGLTACAAPAARARVSIRSQEITVSTRTGAKAVITRSPFRITFFDRRGHVVLQEASPSSAPFPVPPATQNEFGTVTPPPPVLYSPLSFLVGQQSVVQEPAGQWEGTLHSVTEGGIEYSAQRVVEVHPRGHGVDLTLSTDDPTGRRLLVRVIPGVTPDAITVTARPSSTAGLATMTDSFASGRSEAFHGFGGRHDYLDQHGQEFYNWLQQENLGSGQAQSLTEPTQPSSDRYLFPNGPSAAYYVQSSFVSSRGYGFLLDQDQISHWRLDSDHSNAWQIEAAARMLHYVVIPAAAPRAIGELTRMTGRQPVPPRWAAGSQYDRLVRFPSDPPSQYEQEVQSDIRNID
jgi:hypothetical protein